jgi:pimeloyl-ACP methyl ester carboxylesterase
MNLRIGFSRRNFVIGAAASAVIATPRISAAVGPTIWVQPDNDLQDIPLSIGLSGFAPRQPVTVTAEMVTRDHFHWGSAATFVAGADGGVDVGTTAPVGGSYSGVSPMGLIWSMEPIGWPEWDVPTTSVRLPATVTFRAEAENGEGAQASVIRAMVGPGVTFKLLAEDGLRGVWYLPPGDGPHPAVIVLGGSEGGLPVRFAAPLLASHGYATLALAYFGLPGLPRGLVNIPLEYFGKAIAHVRAAIAPRNDFVAVYGMSRGGELALLIASLYADIRAVVAVVPSGVVFGAFGPSEPWDRRPRGAWTLAGKPLPDMSQNNRYADSWVADPMQSPIRGTPRVLNAMRDLDAVERATIAVERIKGPVLMVSGRDDQIWPSFELAEIARRRLQVHNHPWPFEHISYPDAGHVTVPPYAPTTATTFVHPMTRRTYALGGTPKGQIEANVAYWRRTLDFLAEAAASDR